MRNLFNLDNPFIQMLARLSDLILLNLLFLLCSLPVFTIGASMCALHQTMQDMVREVEGGYFRRFFQAFRSNFKQGTILWLATVVVIVSLVCDFLLIMGYFSGTTTATVLYVLLVILAVIVVGVLNYMFPLIVRYTNTMREHLSNAIILAICKLPRTLLLVLLTVWPVILAVIAPNAFVSTLIFWVIIGFSFEVFVASSLLKPVFDELERVQKGEGSVSIMK